MIFLIGFMGAGKTTVGEQLARELNMAFIDTDQLIEDKYKMTISGIFEKFGEKKFREMETEILEELESDRSIVTTGGGMPGREANRSLMREKGKVVWLNCSFEEIKERVADDVTRPILVNQGLEAVKALYKERIPLYESAADYNIETSGITVEDTVKKILSCLKIDRHGETNE